MTPLAHLLEPSSVTGQTAGANVSGVALLALGGALLWWGAEQFMEHIAALANRVGLPVVAAGLLLAGAEPEEMATALIASAQGHPVLAATDALGANVTMITLGLGLALVVSPVPVERAVRWYAVTASGTSLLVLITLRNGLLGRSEGFLLLGTYLVIVTAIWRIQRTPPKFGELAEDEEDDESGEMPVSSASPLSAATTRSWRPAIMVATGLFAMVTGGAFAVRGAELLAQASGLGEQATGLTALAFATSVEVLALVAAARRRTLSAVAVGGVLGSVTYNATVTMGGSAQVAPMVLPDLTWVALLAAVLPVVLLCPLRSRYSRLLGVALLLAYLGYLIRALIGPA